MSLSVSPNTLEVSNIFSRLQVINKELEIIFTFSIHNPTENTVSPSNVQLGTFTLPAEIGSKIIDLKGQDLTVNDSLIGIAALPMCNSTQSPSSTTTFQQKYGILSVSHNGANKLFIACYSMQGIAAGATHTYTGRIQLTLI